MTNKQISSLPVLEEPLQHPTPSRPGSHANAAPASAVLRPVDAVRRTALFAAILISGGNLLIPRLPVLAVLIVMSLLAMAATPTTAIRARFGVIYSLLAVVFLAIIFRSGLAEISSLVVRYANFLAGILLLKMYLKSGTDALVLDLQALLRPLAWIALATVFLATLFEPIFTTREVEETTYHHFLYIFNYHVMLEDAGGLHRPNGLFFEPGVFQIYLNLYLYLALFVLRSRWQSALALAAVLATQSTTGLAVSAILMGVYFWRLLGRGPAHHRMIAAIAGVLIAVSLSGFVIDNVQSKFTGDFRGSWWARQYDLLTGLNVVAANPWLGIGFDPDQYRAYANQLGFSNTDLDDRQTIDRGNSNGIVGLLYAVGIPLALPFLWGLFRQRMLPDRALVGTVLFISFLSEAIVLTPFFLLFLLSGLLRMPAAASQAPPRPTAVRSERAMLQTGSGTAPALQSSG